MKKTIEIKKKIDFSSMIGEITAISLENHLAFVDEETIQGAFSVVGRYKSTVASRLEEEFHHDIPIEIALTEKVDPSTGVIDVEDFFYDVMDGEALLCNVKISITADEILEERECDGDSIEEKEMEIPHVEVEPLKEERVEEEEPILEEENSIMEEEAIEPVSEDGLFSLNEKAETYGTFVVYIVRQNETIHSIVEKYHTSVEEIEKYNDLKDLSIGSKVIIPISNEEAS